MLGAHCHADAAVGGSAGVLAINGLCFVNVLAVSVSVIPQAVSLAALLRFPCIVGIGSVVVASSLATQETLSGAS